MLHQMVGVAAPPEQDLYVEFDMQKYLVQRSHCDLEA